MEYRFTGISDSALCKLSHLVSESEMEVTREEHSIHLGELVYKNTEVSCIISPKNYKLTVLVCDDCIIIYSVEQCGSSNTVRIGNNEYATFTVM